MDDVDDLNVELQAELIELDRSLSEVLVELAARGATEPADAAAVKVIESVIEGVASVLDRPVTCAEAAMVPLLTGVADLLDARVTHSVDPVALAANLRVAVVDLNHGLDVEVCAEGFDFLEVALALLTVLRDPGALSPATAARLVQVLRLGARAIEVARERDVLSHRLEASPVVVFRPGVGPVPLTY
jgi:hypothetical protein